MNASSFSTAPGASQERLGRSAARSRRDRPAEDLFPVVAPADSEVPASAPAAAGEILHLPPGTARSLRPTRGLAFRCTAGVAWVTQSGCGEDVLLAPGDTHAPRRRGKIVLQPLTGAGAVVHVRRTR